MTRAALVLVVAAMLASAGSAFASSPLIVETALSPEPVFFADTVTARVDVIVDRRRVDPASVRVEPSFGNWSEVASTRTATSASSTIVRQTSWYSIACLTSVCVPSGTRVQSFPLPPVTVTARTNEGTTVSVRTSWPALGVAGRFEPPPNTNVSPAFEVMSRVPSPTYRLNPTSFALGLDLLGGLLIAVSCGVGGLRLARRWAARRSAVGGRPPLHRALALVRAAQTRAPEDRRRAVGLLARTLPGDAASLTSDASRVAWSLPEPTPERLEELARTVEAEIEQSP